MLEDLQKRALASSEDRGAWLLARARGVTATDVAKLAKGNGPAITHELAAHKLAGGVQDLSHVPYVRHGQQREPVIAAWILERFGIEPSQTLFHAVENSRHLATPDGVGWDFDENVITSEIKTSKYDLDPAASKSDGHFWKVGYYDQIQWQHYVTGASRSLFAWEQHDDDWWGWPERSPRVKEIRFAWIPRDDARIDRLVTIADKFLVYLDAEKDVRGHAEPDAGLVALAREAYAAVVLEREAKAKVAETRRALEETLSASGENYSHQFEGGRISWSAPTIEEVVEPDVDAALAADPDLHARMLNAVAEWEVHQSHYVKPGSVSRPGRLQITPRKEK